MRQSLHLSAPPNQIFPDQLIPALSQHIVLAKGAGADVADGKVLVPDSRHDGASIGPVLLP